MVMSSDPPAAEQGRLRFAVHLGVIHSTLTPDEISAVLELDGVSMRSVEDPPTAADGTPLAGGYADTFWRYTVRGTEPDQYFDEQLAEFVERLRTWRGTLAMLRESGGATGLTVEFLGDGYFAGEISHKTLTAIVELGLELSIISHTVPQP